jgi:hypothetical protein
LDGDVVTAMTRQPIADAICTAALPTPPLAPVTSTVSLGLRRPRVMAPAAHAAAHSPDKCSGGGGGGADKRNRESEGG